MKKFLMVFLLAALCFGQWQTVDVHNTSMWSDTLWIDSNETERSRVFWQTEGASKSLLIEAFDDSTAGFASDSACVKIQLEQAWEYSSKHIVILGSHNYPDSVNYANYLEADSFMVYDSLFIGDMDTTAKWVRASTMHQRLGTDSNKVYNDDLDSIETTTHGAFSYRHIDKAVSEYSPGVVLKLTGLKNNLKEGAGSRWIIYWSVEEGQPVYNK